MIGLLLLLTLLRLKMNFYSGNDDDHDQDKMDEKGKAVLDKIRMTTHEDYLKVQSDCMCCVTHYMCCTQGNATGSIRASDRLMRELSDIYKSDSYKKGNHSLIKVCF